MKKSMLVRISVEYRQKKKKPYIYIYISLSYMIFVLNMLLHDVYVFQIIKKDSVMVLRTLLVMSWHKHSNVFLYSPSLCLFILKGNFAPALNKVPSHERIWENTNIAPHFLNLRMRWRRSNSPRALFIIREWASSICWIGGWMALLFQQSIQLTVQSLW
jgi:hypothetical protein